jgi:hypothetical protein
MGAIKGRLIAVVAGGVALAFSGEASAAEVIGQTGPPTEECGLDQPYTQQAVGAAPAYSPSAYGVITSWSAFGGLPSTEIRQLKLMVLEPAGGTSFKTVRRDTARTLTANVLNTFTGLSLPIEPTQRLGLYALPGVGASPGSPCAFTTMNSSDVRISAANGEPGDSPVNYNDSSASSSRLNARAIVEPDTDRDVFGDETQDKCVGTPGTANGCPSTVTIDKLKQKGDTKVKAAVTVPGAGSLKVGSASDPALASAAAKKTVKAVTTTLTSTSKQQLKLTLKLTKSAIGKLEDKDRLKLKVKAVYTPTGGPPGSQTKKKKLKS